MVLRATVPRTRSQVAPDWTTKEALILLNEVAAFERDCSKALSSYEKWNIIVQKCTAMEVSRPLSQCRNKWNSLLLHYNQIKLWDSDSFSPPYCCLPIYTRQDFGLPLNFDEELFQATDDYTKVRNHQPLNLEQSDHPLVEDYAMDGCFEIQDDAPQQTKDISPKQIQETVSELHNEKNKEPSVVSKEGQVKAKSQSRKKKELSRTHSLAGLATVIGIKKYMTPNKDRKDGNRGIVVESFVSDKYQHLVKLAALH